MKMILDGIKTTRTRSGTVVTHGQNRIVNIEPNQQDGRTTTVLANQDSGILTSHDEEQAEVQAGTSQRWMCRKIREDHDPSALNR